MYITPLPGLKKLDVASAYISENCAAGGHCLYLHDPDNEICYDERDTNEVYNENIRELSLEVVLKFLDSITRNSK